MHVLPCPAVSPKETSATSVACLNLAATLRQPGVVNCQVLRMSRSRKLPGTGLQQHVGMGSCGAL
jgi:hypothetical protein